MKNIYRPGAIPITDNDGILATFNENKKSINNNKT